jgi:AcrR family transcriptional regulator
VASEQVLPKRRRRRPEEAEREILDAARQLLSSRPAHEVTVSAIMDATTLSRKSFYVYFRDRHDVITRLVAPLRTRGDEAMEAWRGGDLVGDGRAALRAVAQLYADEGPLLRALFESSARDHEAWLVWREFTEPVIALVADRIRAETAAGRIAGLDAEPTARALISMNLRCFFDQLVDQPDPDIDGLVDTLLTIWVRTLTGERE